MLRGRESNRGLGDYEPPVQPYTTPYCQIALKLYKIFYFKSGQML